MIWSSEFGLKILFFVFSTSSVFVLCVYVYMVRLLKIVVGLVYFAFISVTVYSCSNALNSFWLLVRNRSKRRETALCCSGGVLAVRPSSLDPSSAPTGRG